MLSAISALVAKPNLIPCLIAPSFNTGRTPGSPRSIKSTRVFASSPNWLREGENSLVLVVSCTWTSKPITGCQPFTKVLSCANRIPPEFYE